MKKRKHSSPGMLTVEMAILFPVIMFTVIGLIYIGIIHHQTVTTRTAAMRTASKVSYTWSALGSDNAWDDDGRLKKFDYSQHDPYAGIVNTVTGSGKQKANAVRYFELMLGKNPQLLADESQEDLSVEYHFGLFAPSVEAKITKHYVNPLGHMLELVGIGAEQTANVSAKASVTDPVDFIRTAGIVYDLFKSGK